MEIITLLIMILATLVTFGLYSSLTGIDNPFYAFAEHSYIGAGIGFLVVMSLMYLRKSVIEPILLNPLGNFSLVVGLILGLLMLTRVSPEYSYLARIPITIGVSVALGISTRTLIFTSLIKQITATFKPLWGVPLPEALSNLLVLIFISSSLIFFLYTIETKGVAKKTANLGKYVLYAGFGALYAQTFMGRIGLFLGRMETMLFPMSQRVITLVVALGMLVIIYVMSKYYPDLLKRLMPQ